jgi:hypothetical protein
VPPELAAVPLWAWGALILGLLYYKGMLKLPTARAQAPAGPAPAQQPLVVLHQAADGKITPITGGALGSQNTTELHLAADSGHLVSVEGGKIHITPK